MTISCRYHVNFDGNFVDLYSLLCYLRLIVDHQGVFLSFSISKFEAEFLYAAQGDYFLSNAKGNKHVYCLAPLGNSA